MDAITGEEMAGAAPTAEIEKPGVTKRPANAFTELMSPKKPKSKPPRTTEQPPKQPTLLNNHAQRNLNRTHGRDALIAYTQSPSSFPTSRVIAHDEDFVIINDLYPKSQIHLLLLPRDPSKQLLHPYDALDGSDPDFLSLVQTKTAELRRLAASELKRRFGTFSALEPARDAARDADPNIPESDLPPGKNWESYITSGVHAHPSMNHLHIHILSTDHVSECMRHRKHYNSFATPFLVPVEDMPLGRGDERRHPGREGYLDRDLVCWRCGKNFKNKFARLQEHLAEEFEAWKKE